MPILEWNVITKLLQEALASYNDLVAAMNLVLFEDAMMHICRYLGIFKKVIVIVFSFYLLICGA